MPEVGTAMVIIILMEVLNFLHIKNGKKEIEKKISKLQESFEFARWRINRVADIQESEKYGVMKATKVCMHNKRKGSVRISFTLPSDKWEVLEESKSWKKVERMIQESSKEVT